jgi:hypothetical protein
MTPQEKEKSPQQARRPVQDEERRSKILHEHDPEKERARRNERAHLLRTKNRVRAARFR